MRGLIITVLLLSGCATQIAVVGDPLEARSIIDGFYSVKAIGDEGDIQELRKRTREDDGFVRFGGELTWNFLGRLLNEQESMTWLNPALDMAALSRAFPGLVFRLLGEGKGRRYILEIKDGKGYEAGSKIKESEK